MVKIKDGAEKGSDNLADIRAKIVLLETKFNALVTILHKEGVTTREEVEDTVKSLLKD